MKRLGPPSLRVKMGLGLDTHPDATLLRQQTDPRAPNLRLISLESGLRVLPDHGALLMDKGTVEFSSVAHKPVGIHRHGTASKLLAVTEDAGVYVDTPGDGSSWDLLSTLEPTRKSVAGRDAVTYMAESGKLPVRYTGGTSVEELPDIIRPEDADLDYAPEPSDILIDDCNEYGNEWSSPNSVTLADDTALARWGTAAMKLTFPGSVTGERVDKDLGSGSEIDLSNSDFLAFWVLADTAGEYLVFKMSEDNDAFHTLWVPIEAADVNKWKMVVWDLTGIPEADRDAIRYLRFGIPQTQACVVAIDHIAHSGGLYGNYNYAIKYANSTTGWKGPIGEFRQATTVEGDAETNILPQRCFWIPGLTMYMPETADTVNLYRTMGGGSEYYLIAVLTAANWLAGYTDNTPDEELTEDLRLTSWWGQVPRTKWLMARGDRLWYMGGEWCAAREGAVSNLHKVGSAATNIWSAYGVDQALITRVELSVDSGDGADSITVAIQTSPVGEDDWSEVWSDTFVGSAGALSQNTWESYDVSPTIAQALFYRADLDWRLDVTVNSGTRVWHRGKQGEGVGTLAFRVYVAIPNGIFMSNLGKYEQVPPLGMADMPVDATTGGYFEINPGDGQAIQDWCEHGSDILVLKERRGYLVLGTNMDTLDIIDALPSEGCGEPETLVDCGGMAVWMNQNHQIFAWQSGGGQPIYLGREIEDWLKSLTITSASAVYWKRSYWLTVNVSGASYGRVYSFDEQAWSPCLPNAGEGLAFGPTQSSAVLYTNTGSSLVEYGSGYTDAGADIDWNARSMAITADGVFEDPATVIRLRAYRVLIDATASAEIDSTGTVTFTNGSKSVTGSGTNFPNATGVILGGDGRWYEIASMSGTTMTLVEAYYSATEAGVAVSIYDTPLLVDWYVDRATSTEKSYAALIPSGSGIQEIEDYPHPTIMGESIAFRLRGAHDAALSVYEVQLWLSEAR